MAVVYSNNVTTSTFAVVGSVAAMNIDEQATPPSDPAAGDIYLDDGTNTASAGPGWRRYTGADWEDIGATAGGASPWSESTGVIYPTTHATDTVVIGTNSMTGTEFLRVAGNVNFDNNLEFPVSSSSAIGVITKGGFSWIHDFEPAGANGGNIFIGGAAGNFTMSGTTFQSSLNVGVGVRALGALTTGFGNLAFGTDALGSLTTGYNNVALGNSAMFWGVGSATAVAIGEACAVQTPGGTPVTAHASTVYIGYDVRPSSATPNGEVVIGAFGHGYGNLTIAVGSQYTTNIYNHGIVSFLAAGSTPASPTVSAIINGNDGDTVLGGNAMSGTERLRVVGTTRLEGNCEVTTGGFTAAGEAGLSDTYSFGGGSPGDVATMTFTGGILTGVTLVA